MPAARLPSPILRVVRRAVPALAAALVLAPAAPAAAQLVPADSAAVLLQAARSFEAEGRPEVAAALYQLIAERYGSTAAGIEARERLAGARAAEMGQSGRTELQVWTTMYGLWLGVAIPAAFGAEGSPPYGVGLLLGGPAGLFAGRALSRSALSPGQTRAITFGGTWGTWQGLGWAEVLDLGENEEICEFDVCYVDGDNTEEQFAAMILGGVAGIAAGSLIARNPVPWAVATAANHGALWGTWFGVAGAVLADVEDDGLMGTTLVAGNLGLVGGAFLADQLGWSRNRVRMVSVGGLIGGLGGLGIDLIIQEESDKTAVAIPLATSLLGLAVASAMTGHLDAPARGGAGDVPPGDFALLSVDGGRLRLGTPVPTPTLVPWEGDGRPGWRPAVSLPLFRATF